MTQLSQHKRREETGTLFPLQGQIRIVEIGKPDVSGWDGHVKVLRALINANQSMYPDIDRWFSTKVLPGLKSSERIAYVAYEGENPIASAVLKLGKRAKFCHLRIREDFQDQDLGQVFFTLMTLEIRHLSEEVSSPFRKVCGKGRAVSLTLSVSRQRQGLHGSIGKVTRSSFVPHRC